MSRETISNTQRNEVPYKLAYKLRNQPDLRNVTNLSRMTAITASGDGRNAHGQAYKDKSKPTDIRSSNINAAKGKYIIILKYILNVSHSKNLTIKGKRL